MPEYLKNFRVFECLGQRNKIAHVQNPYFWEQFGKYVITPCSQRPPGTRADHRER